MTLRKDVTQDDYLGGKVRITQPKTGYRAGVDPVLLAASVPAKPGQSVLELGCGVGVASLCLSARVTGLSLTGLELQADYAALAQSNAVANGADMAVVTGDLADMPPDLRQQSFDHVIANPPYFLRTASVSATDQGREIAMGEDTPLDAWVKAAAKRLGPKGTASFIHRAERLGDMLRALSPRLGSVQVLPLVPRAGRDARLILIRAKKGGRAPLRLHDSVVMHDQDRHTHDEKDYSATLTDVLRNGGPLPFPE